MQTSLLTPEDKEWLAKHAEACRLSCDFILSDFFRARDEARSSASAVIIWHEGEYIQASDLKRQIEEKVPYSQIFEQWECRVYEDVQRVCRCLSRLDARALLVASGFESVNADALYACAGEAVNEAWQALYGEPDEDVVDWELENE